MASKRKLALRKELEKFYSTVKAWSRQDLTTGRWFAQFVERTLAAYTDARTPPQVRAEYPDITDQDELIEGVTNAVIHRAIAATDAYKETLTRTEIRNLKDRKTSGPPVKLTGDSVALIAELLYVIKADLDLMFDVAAAHGRLMTGASFDLATEVFAGSLGTFDVAGAKAGDGFAEKVGAKIFERAVIQTIGAPNPDAFRKGFYCYLTKAIGDNMGELAEQLEEWSEPSDEAADGDLSY
ncbi:hypothetical protein ACFL59_05885 [Planctomycetota bacterium]